MRREAQINRDVQKRNNEREIRYIEELQEKQIDEKNQILLEHLPDSLITHLNSQMGEEDRKNMEELRETLKKQNEEKLAEMEKKQRELEEELARQKRELDRLGDLER